MKKRIIPLLSALLTVALLATLALFSGAATNEPELKIAYCTLEFGQDTHILYAVTSEGVENIEDIEVLVWRAPQTDYTSNPDVTLEFSYEETIGNDKCAVFEFKELGAMNMADNYYACAHVKVDGEDIYSPVNKYSVLQYAYNMLGKAEKTATDDAKLKDLLNSMLDYGSKVQTYANYKTERLANANWYYINIEGGTLDDGFDHGLYLRDDVIIIKPIPEDNRFAHWADGNGNKLQGEDDDDGTSFKIGDLLGDDDEKTVITISAEKKPSEGLEFSYYSDGTCYVSGIGTCTDTDIVIPETSPAGNKVTRIGDDAFKNCTSLTSVTIPDSVTDIGWDAFSGCTSLASVTIGNGVTSIGSYAFYGCTSLERITVASGNSVYHSAGNCLIKTASKELILGCKNSVIPTDGSVTSIGGGAFEFCTNLTSIKIPNSVISIGSSAFEGCTRLESVIIGNSVTSIGYYAFEDCTSLTSVTIPDSVTSISRDAFSNTAYYNNDENWADGVLYIGKCLIEAKTSISGAYIIKDGTKCIADSAFYDCTSLTSVTIPDSVKNICVNGFGSCMSLTNITIPNSVTSIGSYAFDYCSSLTSITIPESVTSIGYNAFYNTAYYDNDANWTDGALYIGKYLIEAKTSISGAYTLKDGTKCIANYAFHNCKSLTSITIPDSVTSIGEWAFDGCTNLTSVTIGNGVTSIGNDAFYDCKSLTKVYYTGIIESWLKISFNSWSSNPCCYGTELYFNDELVTEVDFPDSFMKIGYEFSGCTSLTSVTIPDSVTSIGFGAFYSCTGLTSVTIPDSVKSVDVNAFGNCTNLNKVYYSGTADEWSEISIDKSYTGNTDLTSATRYYYSETEPTESGNWWHYDENGIVTEW